MNKFRTRNAALVMGIAAIAVAGCGSSSKSKTTPAASTPAAPSTPATPSTPSTTSTTAVPNSVKQQAKAAVEPFLTAVQQLKANPSSAKDPATYTHLADTLRTAADKLGTLPVPAADKAKLDKGVALIKQEADNADKLAKDLKDKDQAAFKADLQKFENIGTQLSGL